ncbi:sigma-70 family RNA polymerase sigma factor [Pedobacter sp. MR2016-19]|uniref:RNA polymerase sigma factor n=1 Tax=Pedobacter sp. MR2016-19 TaxID=2780089 RepID=UPI0018753CFB|nr:sigma-70 family RNA polymerase sigma factor [Pedobacter sp. MR2016-19]MBE5320985.1 sigma-70 family RNA polymerase sigma factor [Pedobacter sp. MR2016-19]
MNLFFKQDTKLIKGCKANERQAQEGLYKLYYADMLRICFRYLKSDDLAQDALNVGFLKIFQHIQTFDAKKGEFGAWIRTVMVRSCIDISRREARFNETVSQDEIEEIFIQPSVLDKLFVEDLLKLIRLLPTATQLVFNLSVIDGYSHKEIGEHLNITESTSRWHLTEAKKQLRKMLASSTIDKPTENIKRR